MAKRDKPMTVAKLIHKLGKLDPGLLVDVETCDCLRTAIKVQMHEGRVLIRTDDWRAHAEDTGSRR